MTRDGRDEAEALGPFFAAASADDPTPRTELLNAVLADAAEVSAARSRPAPASARPWPWRGPGALFAPIGGWRGATALGACVALGFGAGLLGGGDIGAATIWGDTAAADPVADFFDLATAEG